LGFSKIPKVEIAENRLTFFRYFSFCTCFSWFFTYFAQLAAAAAVEFFFLAPTFKTDLWPATKIAVVLIVSAVVWRSRCRNPGLCSTRGHLFPLFSFLFLSIFYHFRTIFEHFSLRREGPVLVTCGATWPDSETQKFLSLWNFAYFFLAPNFKTDLWPATKLAVVLIVFAVVWRSRCRNPGLCSTPGHLFPLFSFFFEPIFR